MLPTHMLVHDPPKQEMVYKSTVTEPIDWSCKLSNIVRVGRAGRDLLRLFIEKRRRACS